MPERCLRAAVIGVGHLGRHHARILAGLNGVTLSAVVDINASRAAQVASSCGTIGLTDSRDLLGHVDAVVVAVPTESHQQVALPFLQRGTSVLVEKPLARSVAEAEMMIEAAAASGAVLAVGHSERFNPALAVAVPLITVPRFIEVHRLGTSPERSRDIDVVFDLMIHDLDIVLSLVGSDVRSIEAVGVPVLTAQTDIANARLRFASGCIVNLTASRISREPVRKMRIFQPQAYLSVDFAAQELECWRLAGRNGIPAIEGGKLDVDREEPLKRELEDFMRAAKTGQPAGVPGEDGRRAVSLAQRIAEQMKREIKD